MRRWTWQTLTTGGLALLGACSADPTASLQSRVPRPLDEPLAALSSPIPVTSRGSVTRTVGKWQVTITDLGLLPGGTYSSAYDINNLGQVVGIASDASGMNRRVVWQNGAVIDTLPQPGSAVTTAWQMNENGQFVGFANQGGGGIGYGVFWSGGTAMKLQPFPGTSASGAAANGLNAFGDVAGGGTGGGTTEPLYRHAGIWRNGLLYRDIGTIPGGTFAMANDINDVGQVTGKGTAGGTGAREYAWIWQNGTYTILPDLPGSFLQSVGVSINQCAWRRRRAEQRRLSGRVGQRCGEGAAAPGGASQQGVRDQRERRCGRHGGEQRRAVARQRLHPTRALA